MQSYDIPIFFSKFYLTNSPRYEFLKICVITTTSQHLADRRCLSCNNLRTKRHRSLKFFVYRKLSYVLSEYAIITVVLHLRLPTKNLNIGNLANWYQSLSYWYRNAGSANSCFGYRHNGTLSHKSTLNSCWDQHLYWNHLTAVNR